MVDHDAKFTSEVFSVLVKNMGSILIVGSAAYHKNLNANAKVEWANSDIRVWDKVRAYASRRKDSDKWDSHLTPAEFAIINTFLLFNIYKLIRGFRANLNSGSSLFLIFGGCAREQINFAHTRTQ